MGRLGEASSDYDEWQGQMLLEVRMKVRAVTGRPKHTDPNEFGPNVVETVKRLLHDEFHRSLEFTFGEVRLAGYLPEPWDDWELGGPDEVRDAPPAHRTALRLLEVAEVIREQAQLYADGVPSPDEVTMDERIDLEAALHRIDVALSFLGWGRDED
jgi:hypothetical protein